MFKQLCFFKKRQGMTMAEFMDYYETQHSKIAQRLGIPPALPNSQRYVRRYLTPLPNPYTGEVLDPGYDCIMEIWWNNREDYERAMKGLVSDPEITAFRMEDELKLFSTNSNPICTVAEHDEFEPLVDQRS